MDKMPPMPKNYLVESILATMFCCMPLGIVALINASGVSSAYYRGEYALAQYKSAQAKKWLKWSVITGVLYIIFWVVILYVCNAAQDSHVFMSHPGMAQ
ncbi:MAG: CD225/dispanin family protein [Bacteroidales bacterium]|nr:CD225/dispanin family protein [Candidatus Sodaliphilus fimicaballi]